MGLKSVSYTQNLKLSTALLTTRNISSFNSSQGNIHRKVPDYLIINTNWLSDYYTIAGLSTCNTHEDTVRERILDSLVFSGADVFGLGFAFLDLREQFLSFLQLLSPLKINICVTKIPSPTATLYQAMERN